jgi:N-methylhydantoinase B
VDAEATDKLRDKMRGERGESGLFSFGGTIDEIKSRSLEETHLPAPVSPHG